MNIFIDTNVLYDDPYFRSNFSELLLTKSTDHDIHIYISSIVVDELKQLVSKRLEEYNKSIPKLQKNITLIQYEKSLNGFKPLDIEDEIKAFDKFYSELHIKYNVTLINLDERVLKEVYEKIIQKDNPFDRDKIPYKDYLIWKSYANYVNRVKIDDCILITNNLKDFCSVKSIKNDSIYSEINENYKLDCKTNFKVYKSIKDYLSTEKIVERDFSDIGPNWLPSIYKSIQGYIDLINSDDFPYIDDIFEGLEYHVNKRKLFYFKMAKLITDVEVDAVDFQSVRGLNFIENSDGCIISFDIDLDAVIEGWNENTLSTFLGGSRNINYREKFEAEIVMNVDLEINKIDMALENFSVSKCTLVEKKSLEE